MRCWFGPLLHAAGWLVARAPQRLLIVAGHVLARSTWWPLAPRRRIARINVGLCLPELPERKRNWWVGWPSGDAVADAARYMREIEVAIRECPEQHLWTHPRFKTRPPGAPSPYERDV